MEDASKEDAPPADDIPGDGDTDAGDIPDDSDKVAETSIQANMRALRKAKNELAAKAKAEQERADKLQKELEKVNTGEAIPDVLLEKEARIAELEPLEKIVKLKTSREYQERFTKPLQEIQTKLEAVAESYAIPKEVLKQALNIQNPAELNRFLMTKVHLDELGALDVKQLVNQARELTAGAIQAEQEPVAAMEKLIADAEVARLAREKEESAIVASSARKGYAQAVALDKKENLFPELVYREDDAEHNKNWAKPIDAKAQAEYGKMVKLLRESGLKRLPEELAVALARAARFLAAGPVLANTRQQALDYATAIEENTRREAAYERPAFGGGTQSRGYAPQQRDKPMTPESMADELLNTVVLR